MMLAGGLTVTRGKKYMYVGIEINFIGDKKVVLFQKDHLLDCITVFGEYIVASMSSLAQKGSFNLNEGDNPLSEERSTTFHTVIRNLFLWVRGPVRIYIMLFLLHICASNCLTPHIGRH